MGSHRSEHVKRHISKYFSACIWLVTTHYYYLLFHNHSDVNFVVGTYILVLGVFACFQSERALLTYATYTLFLSGVLCYLVADLRKTVFLPGLITIFTFSYIAIRQRLKLMTQTRQSSTKIVELFTQVQKGQKDRILFEATREALKIRDDFISIASHELKTPLTSLKLQNEIARRKFSRGPLPAEQTMLLISQVDRQVDRLTRLVEDMIEISRFSSGKFKIVRETFNLSALIADCILSLSQMLQEAGCKLNFEGHQEILISADRFRIEQVLINLLTNAAKYGQSKPIVVR